MGRKRGEYQKQKIRKEKTQTIILCCILLIFGLIFFIEGVQKLVTSRHLQSDSLQEYVGKFQLSTRSYRHNTTYIFTLENGDKVEVPSDEILNKEQVEGFSQLEFHYSRFRSFIRLGTYEGIVISDDSNELLFCNINSMTLTNKGVIMLWFGSLQILICAVLVGLNPHSFVREKFCRKKKKK